MINNYKLVTHDIPTLVFNRKSNCLFLPTLQIGEYTGNIHVPRNRKTNHVIEDADGNIFSDFIYSISMKFG